MSEPNTFKELLQYPRILEDKLIGRLLELNARFQSLPPGVPYRCLPDVPIEDYTYNSNSFAAGLLKAVQLPWFDLRMPAFPSYYSLLFPGWQKPVPKEKLSQQP